MPANALKDAVFQYWFFFKLRYVFPFLKETACNPFWEVSLKKYVVGFKLLALCWFNGYYSRFLDFSLVAESPVQLNAHFFR
jgi:hypothetical protein